MNKRFQAILLGVTVALVMGGSGAYANCINFGGYAIFQCGDTGFFAPPPVTPVFDPNANPVNYSTVFWQIGFGNETLNTGTGTGGTGNVATTFPGNDHGQWVVDLKDAQIATQDSRVPFGAMCLAVNNWANSGIDGCVDNDRTATALTLDHDNILNPDYDVYYASIGLPGYYNYTWHQDYPMAVLVKSIPDARFFAIAANSTQVRAGEDHTPTGPCAATPGSNLAACDFRPGFYNFKDIANGGVNPATGANNVIPWQQVPRPRAACIAGCTGTTTNRTINFNWDPVKIYNDRRHVGTSHPAMGGDLCNEATACLGGAINNPTRPAGVGAVDLMRNPNGDPNNNWAGLARYDLEVATVGAGNVDPNGSVLFNTLVFAAVVGQTDIPQPGLDLNGDPTGQVVRNSVIAAPNTCYRVHVRFGKKPEITAITLANARIGRNGDRGYEVFSLDPATITCVGGSLLSESAVNLQAVKKLGTVTLSWRMTSELSIEGFNIYAVSPKGVEKKIGSLPCQACNTGETKSYSFTAPMTAIKGAKTIVLEVLSSNGNTRSQVNF
jgi:hypothetical protein